MGLLDSVLGALNQRGTGNPLLDSVLAMVNNPQTGGLEGLLAKLQQGGLGHLADSWVSTGKNLPVSADQITGALGPDQLGSLAQGLGMSHGDLSSKLAELLPGIVDKLTPNGQVPDAGALGQLLNSFKDRIG
ncbi:MAG: DUF937 domain-containing protein [Betaproteobacteria bacterium]|nr:DUF937 domain-containing protein [Betaproteobacteria bacterium]